MRGLGRIERHPRIPQVEPPRPKRSWFGKLLRWALAGGLVLALAAVVWLWWTRVVTWAVVEGEILAMTAPASVVVQEVHVKPGDWCEKGRPCIRLAARNVEARRRVLEAQLSQTRLRLELVAHGAELEDLRVDKRLDDRDRLLADIQAARAAAAGAQARLDFARQELAVQEVLRAEGHASDREYNAAETAAREAKAELERAQAILSGLQIRWSRQSALAPEDPSGSDLRQTELALLESQVREAEQRLRQLDYESGTRTLVAPFSGRVDRVYVRPGSHREQGDPLLTLYDPASLHAVAYVKPGDRDRLEIGTPVRMYPEGSSDPVSGVIREVHSGWSRVPAPMLRTFGGSGLALTMRIECAAPARERLAPHMVLKVVGSKR